MFKCCEKPNTQLIQSGGSKGSGINTRQTVTICLYCGEFKVFSDVNFQSQTITFHIWRDDYIEAALIPVNEVQRSEGKPTFYLAQREEQPLENAVVDDFNSSATSKDGGFLERLG